MREQVSHQDLAAGQWQRLSLLEQMANIGSEVGRAVNAREQKNEERAFGASQRALELFDLTLNDPKLKCRLKEIARARECFADYFFGENQYAFTGEWWQQYFLDFAIAARNTR
jgi:hypothetical protein